MSSLTSDAADVISHIRRLHVADVSTVRVLEQLLCSLPEVKLMNLLLEGKQHEVAVALFRAVCSVHSTHLLGYILRFFSDLVLSVRGLGEQLGTLPVEVLDDDPAKIFLHQATIHSQESGITDPALFLAATALRYGDPERNDEALQRFLSYVRDLFSAETLQVSSVAFAVQGCAIVARRKPLRRYFFDYGIVQFLPKLLFDTFGSDPAGVVQLVYETLLLSWLLSYEYVGVVELQHYRMIPNLHRVLQSLQKEKCIRVALMTLWNMVEAEHNYVAHLSNSTSAKWVSDEIHELSRVNSGKGPAFIAEMVGVGMLKTLAQLSSRKFGDEDIGTLVHELQVVLDNSMERLTSFSGYRGEVLSGALKWSPVHTSKKFWKENVMQFESNNYEVLQALGNIIMNTRQDIVLAVACYDLGEVVRHHPTGRTLLQLSQMEGVKNRVMSLMSHPNPEVSKNALLAVQKIMVQGWEYIPQQQQQ